MFIEQLSGKAFLLITGASKGIGKEIAEKFAPLLGAGSHVLLLARDINGLKETAQKLPTHLVVNYESIDLSTAVSQKLKEIIRHSLGTGGSKQFERAIIVHNAGSIGNVAQSTIQMTDLHSWQKYYDLNVFSPAVLNGVFMELFNDETNVKRLVINITSKCAVTPMKNMAYYCSGKAAREMFFMIFAAENPKVNVLNYSPGPVKTNMLDTVCEEVGDDEVKSSFVKLKENDMVLTTSQTVGRLLEVLEAQKYTSGDRIDYYDEL